MPWNENCVMGLRKDITDLWLTGLYSKTELAREFNVSRPTLDKWIVRREFGGIEGLADKSRRPHSSPAAISDELKCLLVGLKLKHPKLGPKKIGDLFKDIYSQLHCPADSTIGEIFKAVGLVKKRRRSRKTPSYAEHLTRSSQPGEVWNADFKGDAQLGDKRRCYPLTVSDDYSRYLLCCQGLGNTSHAAVRPYFEWLFELHGLPDAIKTDNGTPFASTAIGGISQLSKWFIQLGIRPERIDKGKPSQNGRHERMHRTLKDYCMKPPKRNMYAQQVAFEKFRYEYNCERSHEALERQFPVTAYKPNNRKYNRCIKPVEYPSEMQVRKACHSGEIKFKGQAVYVSQILAKEPIGLKETDNGMWEVYYSFQKIAVYNEEKARLSPLKRKKV